MTGPKISADAFMSTAPAPLNGSSVWAARYTAELRRVYHQGAEQAPRSLQSFLGPSEIGSDCDRQVAAKMARVPRTNHVTDPWPSIVGTALHAWAADAFDADNKRTAPRWITETRVTPHPDHPGTADLYDAKEHAVVDWKFLGPGSMDKIKSREGPPRHYVVQLLLYGLGYRLAGLPVDRVVLAAVPRTAASLDGMYCWERPYTPADDELLEEVFRQTAYRKQWAIALITGQASLMDVPATTNADSCYFCLAGETEVVTRDGIKPIRELAGTEPELLVPTHTAHNATGGFKAVPVRALGKQRLYAVNLRRYRATKTIYATAEHRWVLSDAIVQTTTQLVAGDSLATVKAQPIAWKSNRIPLGVAQGFTYGDGAVGTDRRPGTLAIYGRSDKERMLEFFGPVETKQYNTPAGDKVRHLYGLPRFWKKLPPLEESRSFLMSWLAGYFAADGTITNLGQASISSADRASLEFVRNVAAICGVGHGLITTKMRTGFKGRQPTALHTLSLNVRDMPEWFWILSHHIERTTEHLEKSARTTYWSVVSVEATDRVEEVYCATVPDVEAFGLADGITTGNCPVFRPEAARNGGVGGCPGHGSTRGGVAA